jgi:hypothetical protein
MQVLAACNPKKWLKRRRRRRHIGQRDQAFQWW